MRRGLTFAVLAALPAGCGSEAKNYTGADVKAAYFRASDEGELTRTLVEDYWADPDDHQHTNYVPLDGIETCPQAQRAHANAKIDSNSVPPKAGDPVSQFVVAPKNPDDNHTPSITEGGLVFGTSTIATDGM